MTDSPEVRMSQESTVLYGVPKVEYGPAGCTPYPMCVKACANYLGQDVGYDYIMAASGAAFRLTWDTTCWNAGNVDAIFTFDDAEKVYKTGIEALGREFKLLGRTSKVTAGDLAKFAAIQMDEGKAEFISFIKAEIDKGFPCIALGMIGPPEACMITGYRDNGKTLLGWNFFQDCPEFAVDVTFDDSGYFISSKWWENPDTVAVMSLGGRAGALAGAKTVIGNALEVMEGRQCGKYAKGLLAYDAWKKAVIDDGQFPPNAILPILAERLMCHGDAMDCLADGRHNAALYMKSLAADYPEWKSICERAADQFAKVAACSWKMAEVLGGYARNEVQVRNLAISENRWKIGALIDEAKEADSKALELLKQLYEVL